MSSVNFNSCNDTELYQLCRRIEIPVLPSTPRDKLISYLTGEEEPVPVSHPIDQWRHGLMGFILDHWAVLEPQLTCPAKSKNPRECFGCVDTQVMTCIVQNPANEPLIKLHKKEN